MSLIRQKLLEEKMDILLKELGENLSSFSSGLCNAFSFMLFRSFFYGKLDKNLTRLMTINHLTEEELKEYSYLYRSYQQHVVEIRNKLKKTPKLLKKFHKEFPELKAAELEDQYVEHMLLQIIPSERWVKMQRARDFYYYIHTLVASFNPGGLLSLTLEENPFRQKNFIETLRLLPTDEKESEIKIEEVLDIIFPFSRSELAKFLGNTWSENTICEGDFIRIGNGKYTISLLRKNNKFALFDPGLVDVGSTYHSLIEAIENCYAIRDGTNANLTLNITIFAEPNPVIKRPTRLEIIENILKENPTKDFTIPAWNGNAPNWVMLAIDHNHMDMLEKLKDKININYIAPDGRTLVTFAVQAENIDALKILKEKKADLHAKDVRGISPLFVAVENGNKEIVEFLLQDSTQNINEGSIVKVSGLSEKATARGYKKRWEIYLQEKKVTETALREFTPFHVAIFLGFNEIAMLLLHYGADPMCPTEKGLTADEFLFVFGKHGFPLELDADSLLYYAAEKNLPDLIYQIHKKGINVDSAIEIKTPLRIASEKNNAKAIVALLKCGANPKTAIYDMAQDSKNLMPCVSIILAYELENYILQYTWSGLPLTDFMTKIFTIIKEGERSQKWDDFLQTLVQTSLDYPEDKSTFHSWFAYRERILRIMICREYTIERSLPNATLIAKFLLTPALRKYAKFIFESGKLLLILENPATHNKKRIQLGEVFKNMQNYEISKECLDNFANYIAESKILGEDEARLKKLEVKEETITSHLAYSYSAFIYSYGDNFQKINNMMRGDFSDFLKEKEGDLQNMCMYYLSTCLILMDGLSKSKKEKDTLVYRVESVTHYTPPEIGLTSGFYSTSQGDLRVLKVFLNQESYEVVPKQLSATFTSEGVSIMQASKYPTEKEILLPSGTMMRRREVKTIPGNYVVKLLPRSKQSLITKDDTYNLGDFIDEFSNVHFSISKNMLTILPIDTSYYIFRINIDGKNLFFFDDKILAPLINQLNEVKNAAEREKAENALIEAALDIAKNRFQEIGVKISAPLSNAAYILRESRAENAMLTLKQYPAAVRALYYASEHHYAPYMQYDDKEYTMDSSVIIKGEVIYKSNHGLAHVGRTIDYFLKLFMPLIKEYGSKDFKEFITMLETTPTFLDEILTLLPFLVAGRRSEREFNHKEYLRYRINSGKAFRAFAESHMEYYPEMKNLPPPKNRIISYEKFIVDLFKPGRDYKGQELFISQLLEFSHCLDVYRFTNDWNKGGLEYTVGARGMAHFQKLKDYALLSLRLTGDRIMTPYKPYTDEFIRCSRDPGYLLEVLERIPSPFISPMIPSEVITASHFAKIILNSAEEADLNLLLLRAVRFPYVRFLMNLAEDKETFLSTSDTVKKIIEKKSDPNISDKDKRTPLMYAAERGDSDIVKVLLDKKADIFARSNQQLQPLDYAVQAQQWQVAVQLMDSKNSNTDTTLVIFLGLVKTGNVIGLKTLVEKIMKSECINLRCYRDKNGCTPLLIAAFYGYWEMIEALIVNFDFPIDADTKRSVLNELLKAGHIESFLQLIKNMHFKITESVLHELLLKNISIIELTEKGNTKKLLQLKTMLPKETFKKLILHQDKLGNTALHYATMGDNREGILLLTDPPDAINIINYDRNTPLLLAIKKKNWMSMKLLIEFKAVPDPIYSLNENVSYILEIIHEIDSDISLDIVQSMVHIWGKPVYDTLVEKLFNWSVEGEALHIKKIKKYLPAETFKSLVLSQDLLGKTVLHYAIMHNNPDCVRALLDVPAVINKKDFDDATPLFCAIKNNNLEIVKVLFEGSVIPIYQKPGHYLDAIEIARAHKNTELVEFLRTKVEKLEESKGLLKPPLLVDEEKLKTQIIDFAKSGEGKKIKALKTQLSSKLFEKLLLHQDAFGNTALHYAAYHGHLSAIRELIDPPVAINISSKNHSTPLSLAVGNCDWLSVTVLFDSKKFPLLDSKCDHEENQKKLIQKLLNAEERVISLIIAKLDVQIIKNTLAREVMEWAKSGDIYAINRIKTFFPSEIFKFLLECKDEIGNTPLHYAAYNGHYHCVSVLMVPPADINAKNINNFTPLFLTIQKCEPEQLMDVVETLFQSRVLPVYRVPGTYTDAIEAAFKLQNGELVTFLQEQEKLLKQKESKPQDKEKEITVEKSKDIISSSVAAEKSRPDLLKTTPEPEFSATPQILFSLPKVEVIDTSSKTPKIEPK